MWITYLPLWTIQSISKAELIIYHRSAVYHLHSLWSRQWTVKFTDNQFSDCLQLHEGLEPYHMLLDTKVDHTYFEKKKAMLVETKPLRYTLYYN